MPIRKIGNTWYTDFYVNSKRIRKKLSTNKATAQRIYKDLVSKNQLAAFGIVQEGYPLDKLKNDFLCELKPRILPKTYHDYETILNNAFNQMRGVELPTLRHRLNGYIQARLESKKSAKILNRTIGLFKRLVDYGIQTKVITFNPIADLKFFKEKRSPRRVLTAKEITDLLTHSGKYKVIWLTFLSTGLRHSELVNLTWNDVDFDKGMISVKGSKTEAGIRSVPICPDLKTKLGKMSGEREGYVFKTGAGTQFKNNLLKRFHECLKRAGIEQEGLNIHSLRHTFATLLASSNTHPKHIQTLLGHKSAITSLDIYTKVYTEDIKAAMEKINIS
ncbi:MAG: site-specific integrase [Candidatus Scalindua sp.]|nr:site-specific integrase [Candidatus Scalindua sp.]